MYLSSERLSSSSILQLPFFLAYELMITSRKEAFSDDGGCVSLVQYHQAEGGSLSSAIGEFHSVDFALRYRPRMISLFLLLSRSLSDRLLRYIVGVVLYVEIYRVHLQHDE